MPPPTLVVVDDYQPLGRALGFALRLDGWHVELFDDPQAALDHMEQHSVDALLTDFRLPGMNGFALIERLRTQGWTGPILLMSGTPGDIDMNSLERLGIAGVLEKPFPLDQLRQRLRVIKANGLSSVDNSKRHETLTGCRP